MAKNFAIENIRIHRAFNILPTSGWNDGRVGCEGKVDSRVRHQIRLELIQIHIEWALKSQRGRDGRYHLKKLTELNNREFSNKYNK